MRTRKKRTKKPHEVAMFFEGIPASTRDAFRTACALKQVTMKRAVLQFMRDYIRHAKRTSYF